MIASKRFRIRHNVTLRVLDKVTGKLIREHVGHNAATNTMIEGIGHYLAGEGVLRQGYSMLSKYIPRYISLGTMGLRNQEEDEEGLPAGISGSEYTGDEGEDFTSYLEERPGFGSDGYNQAYNNNRPAFGLGPAFTSFSLTNTYYTGDTTYYKGKMYVAQEDMIVDPETGIYNTWSSDQWALAPDEDQPTFYELITPTFPRQEISYRDVVPEYQSERKKTVDIIFSTMISTNALAQFRDPDKDYIFITEAGLWSDRTYQPDDVGANSLVAGYRVAPPDLINWYMKAEDVPEVVAVDYCHEHGIENPTPAQIEEAQESVALENRHILKEQVLRVERDQVVQVIWKIEIGNAEDTWEIKMSIVPGDFVELVEQEFLEIYRLIELCNKGVFARNVEVPTSAWTNAGITGYPYSAKIAISGVDEDYITSVQYADADSRAFDFARVASTTTDEITIYCATAPSRSIIIPLIISTSIHEVVLNPV